MNDWLWAELHDLFDTDDGSLPEVRVDFADKRAVITAFAELRGRGQDVTHGGSTFWSVRQNSSGTLSSCTFPTLESGRRTLSRQPWRSRPGGRYFTARVGAAAHAADAHLLTMDTDFLPLRGRAGWLISVLDDKTGLPRP
jgi:hypothetical protein